MLSRGHIDSPPSTRCDFASFKHDLAVFVRPQTGVDPESLFDVQVKRMHEWKRQHPNLPQIVHHYRRLKAEPGVVLPARTFIFAGKAAPSHRMAKLIIKLISSVAQVINRDRAVRDRLRVVLVPNFNVSTAQRLCPATKHSKQISTAGKEASGTGNMKYAKNGEFAIGILDGANIEIREQVDAANFFLFGLTARAVQARLAAGCRPLGHDDTYSGWREVIDLIRDDFFSNGDTQLFRPIIENLLAADPDLLLADCEAYCQCQDRAGVACRDRDRWTRMSILNTARSGPFSSDLTIRDYSRELWRVPPARIEPIEQGAVPPAPAR